MAAVDNREALSVGQQPPVLISILRSEDTCVPGEPVHDVGIVVVFTCCYMAEVDQMISPTMAH